MNLSQPRRFRLTFVFAAIGIVAMFGATPTALAAGQAKHVVIVIMDGLRRDTITPEQMPTLAALAKTGTFFDNHHPVYPSSTQVNATALATGQRPATSNIIANREYRPELELLHPIDTNEPYYAWKADRDAAGNTAGAPPKSPWVRTPTLPELARAAGLKTVVSGTKAVTLLWDRGYGGRTTDQPTLYEGKAIPSATLDPIIADQGPFPPSLDWKYSVNTARDIWTVRALTEKLWATGVPALTVVWLYEPDFSQHGTGVGSKNAKLAYKSSDDRLGEILAALDKQGVRAATDIVIVSDHGCSTISKKVDVADDLRKRGFKAEGAFHKTPEPGSIVVSSLGGSVGLYVVGGDPAVRQKLIDAVQAGDWAGVIFSRGNEEGTFPLSAAGIESPDAPDLVVSMRWADEISQYGTPGTVVCDGMDKGQGMHVSLSKYDMANTLIAAGPDFRTGLVSKLPSGNADVTPTLAHILGIKPTQAMDGRILTEALVENQAPAGEAKTEILRARRTLPKGEWSQYLKVTTLEGRRYYDEGNKGAPVEK